MLSVMLIWAYMIIVTFLLGIGMCDLLGRTIGYRNRDKRVYLLLGTVFVIWYSQVYSLFGTVGQQANIVLCIICIIIAVLKAKTVRDEICEIKKYTLEHSLVSLIAVILFVLFSYGTSHGYIHYDTGLYHAQAIRWIEEYGVIKGLGNLHTRLAYNSAAFPFTALFSFSFTGIRSFHVTAGFVAWLLSIECIGLNRIGIEKKLTVAAFVRFMGIYYLLMIFDEMISPASDYYMVTMAFILVIRLVDLYEMNVEDAAPYALIALLSGCIITIKLSGALLILTALWPIVCYIKRKEFGKIIHCLIYGVILVVPYLVRNVLLSGYLLYPSTSFDIFNVDWKIPYDIALSDFKEIQVYGRGYTDPARFGDSIGKWFSGWFMSQSALDRLFIIAAIVGIVVYVIKCIYYGFIISKRESVSIPICKTITEGVLCCSFAFWLFTSPLMRYGCLYVYIVDALIWGDILLKIIKNKNGLRVIYIALGLVGLYKAYMFGNEVIRAYRPDTLILQQDYENFEVDSYEVDGVTIYIPVESDRVGYEAFPSSPWQMNIELRGDGIEDGFRAVY